MMEDNMTIEDVEDYKKELNKHSMNIAKMFEESGILFVPIPAISEAEFRKMSNESQERANAILDFNIDLNGQEIN